jgi:hypothetical protein
VHDEDRNMHVADREVRAKPIDQFTGKIA